MACGNSSNDTFGRPGALKDVSNELEYWLFLLIWISHSCTGQWYLNQPTRPIVLLITVTKILVLRFLYCTYTLGLGGFVVYMHGRITIKYGTPTGIAETFVLSCWIVLDMASILAFEVIYGAIVLEGTLAIALALYVMTLVIRLQRNPHGKGSKVWIMRTAKLIIWGSIWGIMSILLWLGLIDQLVLIAWFFTYSAFFTLPPRNSKTIQERITPLTRRKNSLSRRDSRIFRRPTESSRDSEFSEEIERSPMGDTLQRDSHNIALNTV